MREALETVGKEEDLGLKVRMAKAEEEIRIKRVRGPFSFSTLSLKCFLRQRKHSWKIAKLRRCGRNGNESYVLKREWPINHRTNRSRPFQGNLLST